MLMLSAAFGTAALPAVGPFACLLIAGFLVYGVGAGLTMAFDVRMGVRRYARGSGSADQFPGSSTNSCEFDRPTFRKSSYRYPKIPKPKSQDPNPKVQG
jgi:hypothetical protein